MAAATRPPQLPLNTGRALLLGPEQYDVKALWNTIGPAQLEWHRSPGAWPGPLALSGQLIQTGKFPVDRLDLLHEVGTLCLQSCPVQLLDGFFAAHIELNPGWAALDMVLVLAAACAQVKRAVEPLEVRRAGEPPEALRAQQTVLPTQQRPTVYREALAVPSLAGGRWLAA